MNKKKKSLIIVICILILVLLTVIICSLIKSNKTPEPTEKRVRELIYNSYLYYVLTSGNATTVDSHIQYSDKSLTQTTIKLKSNKELEERFTDSFSEQRAPIMYEDVISNGRTYIYEDGYLYMDNIVKNDKCDMSKVDLYKDIRIEKDKDTYYIDLTIDYGDYQSFSTTSLLYEDNKWKLYSQIDICTEEKQ